mmetsp:Transcript_16441/g.29485  ORF Transcript_16441/g.29485 Transcript_16441/m.29485 type:complete len:205 (+) Transcript_16441:917-1531(+)
MKMTLTHLRQNLSLSDNQRIQSPRNSHNVPHRIVARQHEQVFAQGGDGKSRALGQILCNARHGRSGVRGGVINLESIAGTQDGGFGDISRATNFIRGDIPIGFGNGEFFTNIYVGVVNGKSHAVDLQSLRGGFQTFLSSLASSHFFRNIGARNRQGCCSRLGQDAAAAAALSTIHSRCSGKGKRRIKGGNRHRKGYYCRLEFHV